MSHRLYIYTFGTDSATYPDEVAEWKYSIPPLFIPLFAKPKSKSSSIYAHKTEGVALLTAFYDLLEQQLNLFEHAEFQQNRQRVLHFLNKLPGDEWYINASDLYTMSDEPKIKQAKAFVADLKEQLSCFQQAIEQRSLSLLQSILDSTYQFSDWLELLEHPNVKFGWYLLSISSLTHPVVYIFEQDEKFGLKNLEQDVILPPEYDAIERFSSAGYAVIWKNKRAGVVNAEGQIIMPCQWLNVCIIFDDDPVIVIIVNQNNELGLWDISNNQRLLKTEYDDINYFRHRGSYQTKKDKKYALYNAHHQCIIKDSTLPFFAEPNHFFHTESNKAKEKYYNDQGQFLGEYYPSCFRSISEDHYLIYPNEAKVKYYSVFNHRGEVIIQDLPWISHTQNFIAYENPDIPAQWLIHNLKTHKIQHFEQIKHIEALEDYSTETSCFKITHSNGALALYQPENQQWIITFEQNIVDIEDLNFHNYEPKRFPYLLKIMSSSGFVGIYQLDTQYHDAQWIFECSPNITQIEKFGEDGLRIIHRDGSMQYYHVETATLSDVYDYVSRAQQSNLLYMGYRGNQLFKIDQRLHSTECSLDEIINISLISFLNLYDEDLDFFNKVCLHHINKNPELYFQNINQQGLKTLYYRQKSAKNYHSAIQILNIGIERQDTWMMVELANLYTSVEEIEDEQQCLKLYQRAAELGNGDAINNLAWHYLQGTCGLRQNVSKAFELFEAAAEKDTPSALNNLGFEYLYGTHIKQNDRMALDYFLRASQYLGYTELEQIAELHYRLGEYTNVYECLKHEVHMPFRNIYFAQLYFTGLGVKQNHKQARDYSEQALQFQGENSASLYQDVTPAYQILLQYYAEDGEFASISDYQRILALAAEYNVDLNLSDSKDTMPTQKAQKQGFFSKLFGSKP